MNQYEAFRETLQLANFMHMPAMVGTNIGADHIADMWRRINADPSAFSDAKLGRWLGWAQACVVAAGCATLDDVKAINMKWAEA